MKLSVLQGAGNFFTSFSRMTATSSLSKWSQILYASDVCFFLWLFHYVSATARMEYQLQVVVTEAAVVALVVVVVVVVVVAAAAVTI